MANHIRYERKIRGWNVSKLEQGGVILHQNWFTTLKHKFYGLIILLIAIPAILMGSGLLVDAPWIGRIDDFNRITLGAFSLVVGSNCLISCVRLFFGSFWISANPASITVGRTFLLWTEVQRYDGALPLVIGTSDVGRGGKAHHLSIMHFEYQGFYGLGTSLCDVIVRSALHCMRPSIFSLHGNPQELREVATVLSEATGRKVVIK